MNKELKSPLEIIGDKKKRLVEKSIVLDMLKKLIFTVIFIFCILNFVFGVKIMNNSDMFPRVSASDLLIYYRLDRTYRQNDLVVLKKDDKEYVLRVVALGGDEIDINKTGLIINNSTQYNPNIFYQTGIYEGGLKFPIKLKEDEVFLLGDMRDSAVDSRYFGPVKITQIKGKVFILIRRSNF